MGKIKSIKSNNPNASEEELVNIAKRKGGTSIDAIFSIFIISLFALLCIGYVLYRTAGELGFFE